MRLLTRLAGGTGPSLDLHLELAEDVTVGELADHLAERTGTPGGLTLAVGRDTATPLHRQAMVAEVGPRSGSTVHLVAAADHHPPTADPSPAWLVEPGAPPRQLHYGRNRVDGAVLEVAERVTLRSTPGVTPMVDGERVLGVVHLSAGSLLRLGSTTVELRLDGALRPPAPAGPHELIARTPARRLRHEPVTVDLPNPPGAMRLPGFPVLSAMVPLLMGAGLWVATRSLASAVFVLFSFVYVLASGIEARREAKAETRFREQEFRTDLDEAAARVDSLRTAERLRAHHAAPTVEQVADLVTTRGARLWERVGSDDAAAASLLSARLGTAPQEAADRVRVPATGRRDLLAEARSVAARFGTIELPVTVDLAHSGGLAICGGGEVPSAVARALVVQLAGLVGPDELQVRVLADPERAARWTWSEWLPHASPAQRSPRLLVVVDGAASSTVAEVLERHAEQQVHVLWLSPNGAGLPRGLGALLHVRPTGHATPLAELHRFAEDGTVDAVIPDVDLEVLEADRALQLARSLSALRPGPVLRLDGSGDVGAASQALPSRSTLGELTGPEPLEDPGATLRRWDAAARRSTLAAPLGNVGGAAFNVDLRLDGPHALVAGTTGSGKSELLRTLVASLALHHGPDRLNLLLVDYKGGAAFGPLDSLPHVVGSITDLSGELSARALRSLRAEVRRRERVLAAHGVADLCELDEQGVSGRPPALVVVVDEFATLARELPEFVDGLVDVAQRGRSLGVHLVLATQRPAGVVTDAIRANTTLRIALRVADEDDSRDVVDSPAAAHLSREVPGRALARVGPGRHALVQVAWTGAPSDRPARILSRQLGQPLPAPAPRASTGPVELDVAVHAATAAFRRSGLPLPRRPWLEPLPHAVPLSEVPQAEGRHELHLGWIDRPDLQRRDPLVLDLARDGGLLVTGAPGSGRSTALRTLVAALARGGAPAVVHAIDAARGLDPLLGTASVGDVLAADDAERVLRLLRATCQEVRRRGAEGGRGEGLPVRVLLLDGFARFEELYERLNRGEAIELLTQLARDGRAVGVHLAVAAQRRGELPVTLASALGASVHLRCANEDEAVMAGLPADAADAGLPPGRGYVGGEQVQLALATDQDLERMTSDPTEAVGSLPRSLTVAALPRDGSTTGWVLPIGLDADRLGVATLDLTHHHAVVAGPPRSGVSTTLATLAAAADAAYLVTSRRSEATQAWAAVGHVGATEPPWEQVLDRAIDAARSGRWTLVALDGLPELLDRPGGHELEARLLELLQLDVEVPLRIAIGGEVDAMARCYSDVVVRLRSGRTGVLLQVERDLHAGLLHAVLPARDELPPCPGRGWVVGPGTASPVQVATA